MPQWTTGPFSLGSKRYVDDPRFAEQDAAAARQIRRQQLDQQGAQHAEEMRLGQARLAAAAEQFNKNLQHQQMMAAASRTFQGDQSRLGREHDTTMQDARLRSQAEEAMRARNAAIAAEGRQRGYALEDREADWRREDKVAQDQRDYAAYLRNVGVIDDERIYQRDLAEQKRKEALAAGKETEARAWQAKLDKYNEDLRLWEKDLDYKRKTNLARQELRRQQADARRGREEVYAGQLQEKFLAEESAFKALAAEQRLKDRGDRTLEEYKALVKQFAAMRHIDPKRADELRGTLAELVPSRHEFDVPGVPDTLARLVGKMPGNSQLAKDFRALQRRARAKALHKLLRATGAIGDMKAPTLPMPDMPDIDPFVPLDLTDASMLPARARPTRPIYGQ